VLRREGERMLNFNELLARTYQVMAAWGEDPIYSESVRCEKPGDIQHTMPPLFASIKKNATLQENRRQRIKRLMRRLISIEFSMPPKAQVDRYEISPRYRRIE
jgi:hypothetical protein